MPESKAAREIKKAIKVLQLALETAPDDPHLVAITTQSEEITAERVIDSINVTMLFLSRTLETVQRRDNAKTTVRR